MAANKDVVSNTKNVEATSSMISMSPENLIAMIQTAVNDTITNTITGEMGALQQVKNDIVKHLDYKLEQFETQIADLQKENAELKTTLSTQHSEISTLKQETVTLKNQVKQALVHSNNNEQYSRKTSIRIIGHEISDNPRNEDCRKLACELFRNKIGVNIEEGDIAGAHRVGRIIDGKQSIIIKFFSRDTKQMIIENKFKLKGTNIRIYDDLTLDNRKLLNRLRNHIEIESAWYFNGKIKEKTIDGFVFNADIYTDINATCNRLNREHRQRAPQRSNSFHFSDPIRPARSEFRVQDMDVDRIPGESTQPLGISHNA